MKKKILLTVISLIVFIAASLPSKASALTPPLLPFGGVLDFWLPCTCSLQVWDYFTPLYLSPVPVTGPMGYVWEATLLFADFIPPVVPATSYKGAYIPGIQSCWMYAGVTCFPLPVIGTIGFVGSGLPGGI
ncbi:MAG: hypothetical protein WC763_02600 [Candidatus Paceibacterota bacterium]